MSSCTVSQKNISTEKQSLSFQQCIPVDKSASDLMKIQYNDQCFAYDVILAA